MTYVSIEWSHDHNLWRRLERMKNREREIKHTQYGWITTFLLFSHLSTFYKTLELSRLAQVYNRKTVEQLTAITEKKPTLSNQLLATQAR